MAAARLREHRALLESLYVDKDLKMQQVIEYMENEHSSSPGTKPTYERLFRQWGLRKNRRGEDWAWVDHRMRQRRNEGRKSALYIDNKRILMHDVQKEIARHVSTLKQAYLSARMGYYIETPASATSGATPGASFLPPVSESRTPGADLGSPEDADSPASLDTIDPVDESPGVMDNIDLEDKAMVVEMLESCGAFIKTWGSSGRNVSKEKLLELYQAVGHGILVAAQTPKEYSIPAEATPFTTGFNILLATYRMDCDSVRAAVLETSMTEYEDVFRSALFMAARTGVVDLVKILYGQFRRKEPRNNKRETCLHIASVHNHPQVVEFLLKHDVDVNARRWDDKTPWAAIGLWSSHEEVSKLLIQAGARINDTRPRDSMNLLHQEAAGGHIEEHFAKGLEVTKLLVEAGADFNAVSDTGKTPLDLQTNEEKKQ
ncbi:PFS domain-containing protein [Colletotrichum plurivorum]|uniref:PFS domain-containing protein n=1 Tax=Colletotrichum plurivorum TaxID=2175906 RepID=A0A8H6NKU4_9PEZI|nr:PFS domain-containing protein [Colletotrichum plurivorum]